MAALAATLARFAGRRGLLALITIALGALFESAGLVLLIPLFGLVIGKGSGGGRLQGAVSRLFDWFAVTTQLGRLALMLTVFCVLMIVRGIVVTLRDTSVMSLQIEFVDHLRGLVAAALAAAGWDQVLKVRHARVLSVMSSDIQRINGVTHFLLQAGISFVILVFQTALSFYLSPGLALFSLALLAVGAAAMRPLLRRSRALGRAVSTSNLALLDSTAQFLNGLKLALSQNLQSGFAAEFRGTLDSLTARQLRFLRQQSAGRVALTTLSALVGAAVILLGYGLLHLPAPLLIAFLLVIARMSGPARQIQQGLQQLAHGLPAYESIMDLLADLRTAAAERAPADRDLAFGAIVLDGVAYQHPYTEDGAGHGVRGVSLTIEPGSFVGLAGRSGAGKTTLADLLVGLLQPQAGRILIGGVELDGRTLASWRAQLSYISQDPFLFHDSVRRNLGWAQPGASEAQMWAALDLAGASAVVRGMEGGLDAVVGERGSLVSGGERQRIALARALLRQPRLLVMDEATSAIDIEGERELLARLSALRQRPTIVLIAHRSESLAACGRVLHIKDGRLLEEVMAPIGDATRTG